MSLAPIDLPAVAAALLECDIVAATPIGGGSLSEVYRLHLEDTRCVIAKGGPDPLAEADMLEAIRATGAPAPEVIACDEQCLIIAELPTGGRLDTAWTDLGIVLARLHRSSATYYGWPSDYAFGSVMIENSAADNWPQFWAQRRLLPQLPYIAAGLARRLEALARDIDAYLPEAPRAALLHGDLWGGNVLVDEQGISGLIDPACHFGHVEVDLAMLSLFDRPSEDFYAAYGALEPGHDRRIAIYALWPALVHLRLFGSSYVSMVERLLRTAGH